MSEVKVKQAYGDMMELVYGGNTYIQYSGRGIHVCKEWNGNVKQFSDDMGEMPKGATLKRKDKNKAFNKDNCFWDAPIVIPKKKADVDIPKLKQIKLPQKVDINKQP